MDSTAGPFGDASAVSPETAVHVAVRVQCDYKWTLQLYEALDFDPNQDRNKNKADVARFERGIYSFTASAHRFGDSVDPPSLPYSLAHTSPRSISPSRSLLLSCPAILPSRSLPLLPPPPSKVLPLRARGKAHWFYPEHGNDGGRMVAASTACRKELRFRPRARFQYVRTRPRSILTRHRRHHLSPGPDRRRRLHPSPHLHLRLRLGLPSDSPTSPVTGAKRFFIRTWLRVYRAALRGWGSLNPGCLLSFDR